MTLTDSIRAAAKSLTSNLLRSILTTLGIIIGVGAVIVTVGVGAGAEARMEGIIKSLGTNLIYVVPGSGRAGGARLGSGSLPSLTVADAEAIRRDIDGIQYTVPSVRGTRQVVYGNTNWSTSIYGVTGEEFPARDWTVDHGRSFNSQEEQRAAKVALVGATLVEKLFDNQSPIGTTIRVQGIPLKVIGTLLEKGETPLGRDQDDVIFVPLSTAKKRILGGRRFAGNRVSYITVKVEDADRLSDVEADITELLRQRHSIPVGGQDDFRIRNLAEMLKKRQESSEVMSLLLGAVASISMLVGGIGIMNIMLVSVTERTREIGVRMAVGATGGAILSQFLIESVLLSLAGGVLGILLGFSSATFVADWVNVPMQLRPEAAVIAFLFAGMIGVFFGYYPARRAARLDPIEALRHE